jgi:hypothetical protein
MKKDKFNCPNRHNHISAFPAFDREKCPYCNRPDQLPVYVKKPLTG